MKYMKELETKFNEIFGEPVGNLRGTNYTFEDNNELEESMNIYAIKRHKVKITK